MNASILAPFILSYWTNTGIHGPYGTNANWDICFRDTIKRCPRTTLSESKSSEFIEVCPNGIAKKKVVYGTDDATEIKAGQTVAKIGGSEYVFLAIYVCSPGGMN